MKKSFVLIAILFLSQSLHAAESACSDATCVARKNEAMASVFNFLYNEESCVNETQWVKSITRTGDATFAAVCGTAAKTVNLKLKVTPQNNNESSGEGDFFVEIVN